jgi:GDPmannose 4,6-dehydratase
VSADRITSIVTGAEGQDGYYLVAQLLREGSTVHATIRDASAPHDLGALPGRDRLFVHALDVTNADDTRALIAEVRPDELYNLAGLSSVRRSFEDPPRAWRVNADAVHGLLEAVRTERPSTRIYQSSSTDMFGSMPGEDAVHDEASPFRPQSPYAASKAAAHLLCHAYRAAFDLRIACGILSNHESARRPASFLTAKIVRHVREIRDAAPGARGQPLRVGNLAVRREWGHAPDYVDGMIRICRQIAVRSALSGASPEPDIGANYRDYVLGTGHQTAVWELIDRAFAIAGMPLTWDRGSKDPLGWSASFSDTGAVAVAVDPAFVRPAEPLTIGTDPALARREIGWQPRIGPQAFLTEMLESTDLVVGG